MLLPVLFSLTTVTASCMKYQLELSTCEDCEGCLMSQDFSICSGSGCGSQNACDLANLISDVAGVADTLSYFGVIEPLTGWQALRVGSCMSATTLIDPNNIDDATMKTAWSMMGSYIYGKITCSSTAGCDSDNSNQDDGGNSYSDAGSDAGGNYYDYGYDDDDYYTEPSAYDKHAVYAAIGVLCLPCFCCYWYCWEPCQKKCCNEPDEEQEGQEETTTTKTGETANTKAGVEMQNVEV